MDDNRFDWSAVFSLGALHICALIGLSILITEWVLDIPVWKELLICLILVYVRMFGITAGYHRYFSHVSYKTSRWFQFLLALLGSTAAQWGPLKWAALHRHHHRHSDQENDLHSVRHAGFWEAHILWIMRAKNAYISYEKIRDFARYGELRVLDKFYFIPPTLLAIGCYMIGGMNTLFIGFFLSTVLLYHITYSINSLMHLVGVQVYTTPTNDDSRNSFLLALIAMGEGWHNNHHSYPSSERQGFRWWQVDMTHYLLVLFSWCGLVWDLRRPPKEHSAH